MVRCTIDPEKQALRAKLEKDIKQFLANGGKIEQVKFGCFGRTEEPKDYVWSSQQTRDAKDAG